MFYCGKHWDPPPQQTASLHFFFDAHQCSFLHWECFPWSFSTQCKPSSAFLSWHCQHQCLQQDGGFWMKRPDIELATAWNWCDKPNSRPPHWVALWVITVTLFHRHRCHRSGQNIQAILEFHMYIIQKQAGSPNLCHTMPISVLGR